MYDVWVVHHHNDRHDDFGTIFPVKPPHCEPLELHLRARREAFEVERYESSVRSCGIRNDPINVTI